MRIFKDGDQWCALQGGKNIQNGIAVFADTKEEAKLEYYRRFRFDRLCQLLRTPPKFSGETLGRFIELADFEGLCEEEEVRRVITAILPAILCELRGIVEDEYEHGRI